VRQGQDEDDEPALTKELRTVMRPRSVWPLVLLVMLALCLSALALVASRTFLSGLWR
jgi:hypothetical protein